MDDSTRLRVLEPLDGNSLMSPNASSIHKYSQMTPLASSFNQNNTFGRTQTPLLEDGNENSEGLLKWKYEQKEFIFQSNSTPSKSDLPYGALRENRENKIAVPAGRKRNGLLIGAAPKVSSGLQKMASKLELIDNNQFTSLPIAPPSNRSGIDNDPSLSDNDFSIDGSNINDSCFIGSKRNRRDIANEIVVHNNQKMRYVSYRYNNRPNDSEEGKMSSETRGGSKHPIVIVEDYILSDSEKSIDENNKKRKAQRGSDTGIKPKLSVHNLKNKLSGCHEEHIPIKRRRFMSCREETINDLDKIPDELVEERDRIGDAINTLFTGTTNHNDKDEYLSLLKPSINDSLKRCVLCERVLYEFSSMVYPADNYKELVCGSCTERYEVIAKLLEDCEFESTNDGSQDSAIFGDFTMDSMVVSSDIEVLKSETNTPNDKKKFTSNTEPFSATLIETLHSQLKANENKNNNADISSKALNWFMEARRKLRWRWRVSGLLPEFVNRDESNINS